MPRSQPPTIWLPMTITHKQTRTHTQTQGEWQSEGMQSERILCQARATKTLGWWRIQTLHTLSFALLHTNTLTHGWQSDEKTLLSFVCLENKVIHQVQFLCLSSRHFLKLSEALDWPFLPCKSNKPAQSIKDDVEAQLNKDKIKT